MAGYEFPTTRWTRILEARQAPERRRTLLGDLLADYRLPLYVTGRLVLTVGTLQAVVYAVHRFWSGEVALRGVMPVVGGVLGLWTVWLCWTTALEAWRGDQPLWKVWRLWCGAALAAMPTISEFALYLSQWAPHQ